MADDNRRHYKVFLQDTESVHQPLHFRAEDVELVAVENFAYFNFTNGNGDSSVTVHAVPFEIVKYITSDEEAQTALP